MGNQNSNRRREDNRPLLEDYEGIQPIYNELKLVLIGSHDVGKNSIGNEIFRKKVFSFWKIRKHIAIEVTHIVSGRRIHLTRTPGWKEDLNNPQKTKSKILQCVQSLYDTKPHAVLLVLKVESDLSESTVITLEDFLSVQLWSHTIVIFTHGEKLAGSPIERYIKYKNLQPLIDKCGQRYFVLEKNDEQIIETIEDFIVSKDSAGCFKPNNQTNGDDTLQILIDLVERIRSKIASISDFKEEFQENARKQNDDYKIRLEKKDAEIKRLNKILEEKEREITRLQLLTQSPQKIIAELEKTIDLKDKQLRESYLKNEELTKQLKMLREQERITHDRENAHVSYCSTLAQDAKPVNSRRQTATPQHELTSNNSALDNWGYTLHQILEELKDAELKTMKYHMKNWKDEYKIPRSLIEEADRIDLADQMIREWGKQESVLKTRALIKVILHNNDVIIKLFTPVLKELGETW